MTSLVAAAARLFLRVAAIFLLAMVAINVADVGLRSGFDAPIFGTHEVVELMLAAVAYLGIAECFLRGQHIKIELIDQVLPPHILRVFEVTGALAAVVFLCLLTWHMIQPARDYIEFDEITMDLSIPLIWKGALILAGIALSTIAAATMFAREVNRTVDGGE